MKHTRRRAAAATTALAASAVAVTAAALASPPIGFHATNLVAEAELPTPVHLKSDDIKLKTKGPVDVGVQSVTIDPGGRSG